MVYGTRVYNRQLHTLEGVLDRDKNIIIHESIFIVIRINMLLNLVQGYQDFLVIYYV